MTKVNDSEAKKYDADNVVIDDDMQYATDLSGVPITGWIKFNIEEQHGQVEAYFSDGYQNGLIRLFHSGGTLYAEKENYHDKPLCRVRGFYDSGQLESEHDEDKNGIIHGVFRRYYEDGALLAEVNFDDGGKKNGMTRHYRRDGKLWFEVNYSDDRKDGLLKEYDESGQLIKEERYDKGIKVQN